MTDGPINAARRRFRADFIAGLVLQNAMSQSAASAMIEEAMKDSEISILNYVASIFDGNIQVTMTGEQIAEMIRSIAPVKQQAAA